MDVLKNKLVVLGLSFFIGIVTVFCTASPEKTNAKEMNETFGSGTCKRCGNEDWDCSGCSGDYDGCYYAFDATNPDGKVCSQSTLIPGCQASTCNPRNTTQKRCQSF